MYTEKYKFDRFSNWGQQKIIKLQTTSIWKSWYMKLYENYIMYFLNKSVELLAYKLYVKHLIL